MDQITSPWTSVMTCLAVSAGFIAVLYCAPTSLRALGKNHPKVAIFRMIATALFSLIAVTPSLIIWTQQGSVVGRFRSLERVLGLVELDALLWSSARSVGLVFLLFLGPVLVSWMHAFADAIRQADARVHGHALALEHSLLAVRAASAALNASRAADSAAPSSKSRQSRVGLPAQIPEQAVSGLSTAFAGAKAQAAVALLESPRDWQHALPPLRWGMLIQTAQLAWHDIGYPYTSPDAAAAGQLGPQLLALRNLVLAPLTEEWVFRACIGAVLLVGGWTPGTVVMLGPLFFGVAHVHHFWDMVHLEKKSPWRAAVQCAFQFTYTTLFGMYAGFILHRTGSIAAAIAAHAACNFFGFPNIGALTGPRGHGSMERRQVLVRLMEARRGLEGLVDGRSERRSGRVDQCRHGDTQQYGDEQGNRESASIMKAPLTTVEWIESACRGSWRPIGGLAYLIGIVGFILLLVPMTDPSCTGPCVQAFEPFEHGASSSDTHVGMARVELEDAGPSLLMRPVLPMGFVQMETATHVEEDHMGEIQQESIASLGGFNTSHLPLVQGVAWCRPQRCCRHSLTLWAQRMFVLSQWLDRSGVAGAGAMVSQCGLEGTNLLWAIGG